MTTIDTTTTRSTAGSHVDQQRALTTLTAAFTTDPIIRWLFPDDHTFNEAFPRLAQLMGGDAFAADTVWIAPRYAGVALWVAPDAPPSDDDAFGELFTTYVEPERTEAVFDFVSQVDAHHPHEPVWYLPFVGVDPAHQGQGHGADLVRAGLIRADADGLPAYLEATSERNRALYERLGFEVVGEIRAGDSPSLWPMLRPAGGQR